MSQISAPTLSLTPTHAADRRRNRRYALERAAKIYRPAASRFDHAITRNLSRSGLLLDTDSPRAPTPGEVVRIGVRFKGRGIIKADDLRSALVVRSETISPGVRRLALRYLEDNSASITLAA